MATHQKIFGTAGIEAFDLRLVTSLHKDILFYCDQISLTMLDVSRILFAAKRGSLKEH